MKHLKGSTVISAAAVSTVLVYAAAIGNTAPQAAGPNDTISASVEQQGVAISPIPFDKLNLKNRPRALVALGSYLVNGVGDCGGCHTFPHFLGGAEPFQEPTAMRPAILASWAAIRHPAIRTLTAQSRARPLS